MAWDERHDRGGRDQPSRIAAPGARHDRGGLAEDDRGGVTREEDEEEQLGPIGSMLWSLFAGGKQCCSMRDRTRPQDQEAARKAAETGRPPSQFTGAEPPVPAGRNGSAARPALHVPSYPMMAGHNESYGGFPDDDDQEEYPYSASREVPPPVPPSREKLAPPAAANFSRPRDDEEPPASRSRPKPTFAGPDAQDGLAASGASKLGEDSLAPTSAVTRGAAGSQAPVGSDLGRSRDSGGAGGMPKRWEWPPWCLNFKEPCIEVLVEDEDGGESRWVEAEPQSRVVDKVGRDAYLCAEYEWDGELYVQDFGPQHVRRRGQKTTVFELFVTMKPKGDGGDLNRSRDQGGGVMAFLND